MSDEHDWLSAITNGIFGSLVTPTFGFCLFFGAVFIGGGMFAIWVESIVG